MSTKEISLWFWGFVVSFSSLGIRVILASQNEFGNITSFPIFGNSLWNIGASSSL
jgi:hypothetical protein